MALAAHDPEVQQKQPGAGGDGGVGDVEGREMVAAPVEVQEISDAAEDEAVEEIARGAAKHAGQAIAHGPVFERGRAAGMPEQPAQEPEHSQSEER